MKKNQSGGDVRFHATMGVVHMQPIYRMNPFITVKGNCRANSKAYIDMGTAVNVAEDLFERGLCLPSDITMTVEEQEAVIEIIKGCFGYGA